MVKLNSYLHLTKKGRIKRNPKYQQSLLRQRAIAFGKGYRDATGRIPNKNSYPIELRPYWLAYIMLGSKVKKKTREQKFPGEHE